MEILFWQVLAKPFSFNCWQKHFHLFLPLKANLKYECIAFATLEYLPCTSSDFDNILTVSVRVAN
jgi:hypothetical protein